MIRALVITVMCLLFASIASAAVFVGFGMWLGVAKTLTDNDVSILSVAGANSVLVFLVAAACTKANVSFVEGFVRIAIGLAAASLIAFTLVTAGVANKFGNSDWLWFAWVGWKTMIPLDATVSGFCGIAMAQCLVELLLGPIKQLDETRAV